VARAFLAVRDLANTPLQTITSATAALRAQLPEAQRATLDRIDRALAQLHELAAVLREHEQHMDWKPGEEAIDSLQHLRRAAQRPPGRDSR
jgi:hypothetical protein